MPQSLVLSSPHKDFESIKKTDKFGIEYWQARELMTLLGYTTWRNFEKVVKKAIEACQVSGQDIQNHFADISKMVKIGSNTIRRVKDYKLDRYASYLIAQNGDSSKLEIALAQTYFAIQTRKQELLDQMTADEKRLFVRGEVTDHKKNYLQQRKLPVYRSSVYLMMQGIKAYTGCLSKTLKNEKD